MPSALAISVAPEALASQLAHPGRVYRGGPAFVDASSLRLRDALTFREKQTEIEAAKLRLEAWKEEMRVAIKEGRGFPPQPDPVPREPIEPVLMMSDTTIERVASLLATATPKGVLLTRDELAGWLLGMNTYNDGARAFWLEAYGGRRFRVDRQKNPEPIIIPRFAVSWFGGTQPDKVAEIMTGSDDGLLARFMWFWPDAMPFNRPKRPPETEWAIAALDRLRMLELASGDGGCAGRCGG
jgi:hypothetical protein